MKDRWSLLPFLWCSIMKAPASGWRSWESTRVSQMSLSLLSARDFVQIWHEASVAHHYSCARSAPKNFIIKSYPYNFQRTDVTTSEKRNSDITVSSLPINSNVKIHMPSALYLKHKAASLSLARLLRFCSKS